MGCGRNAGPFNEAHARDDAWQRGCASLACWEPFLRRHAIDAHAVDFHRHGALLPIDDENAEKRAEELLKLFATDGVRLLADQELQRLEPAVSDNVTRALWLPGGQVDPRRATEALKKRAIVTGVDVRYQTPVAAINGTSVALKNGATLDGDLVIIAAGAWSDHLAQLADIELRGEPVKGQMCLLQSVPTVRLKHFIHTPNAYVVQRRGAGIVVGATMQTVGFDYSTDHSGIETLSQNARKLLPDLSDAAVIEHWTGMRPRLLNGALLVDQINEHLAIATGHFRNGILLAPWTALRLADRLEKIRRPRYETACDWQARSWTA